MKEYLKILFSFFTMIALFTAVSCEDDNDNTAIGTGNVAITTVNPTAEFPLETVTLEGVDFDTVQFVFLGIQQVEFQLEENSIKFVIPDAAAPGLTPITLAMANNYRVTAELEVLLRPTPVFNTISPSAAAPGENVTITGSALENVTAFKVGGVDATVVSATGTELVFTVPVGAINNAPNVIEITTTGGETASESIFYVGQNYIVNSALEEGSGDDFTGWEKLNGGANMTEVTGSNAYAGRSIQIIGAGGNPWDSQFASTPTPLNYGSEYTVIMWAKALEVGAQMRVSASQYDGNGADYFYGDTYDLSTEWEQISWVFTVTKDLPTHKIVLDMGMADKAFILDNIALIETGAAGPPAEPNILVNSDFEDGLTGWEVLNGDVSLTSADANSGAQSIQVVGAGSNPWNTQFASDGYELILGDQYEVKLMAKTTNPGTVMRISASQYDGNGADYFYGDDVNLTDEWAEYSWKFTVTNDLPVHRIVLDMGTSSDTFFVDDVELRAVPRVNLLANSDFEDGLTSWEVLNGDVSLTSDDANSGSQAIQVVGAGSNPWNTQFACDGIILDFEGYYVVKLMAKTTNPGTVMRISASQYDGNGADYFYGDDVTLTDEWAEYTWRFQVGKDLPTHRVVLDMGTTTDTFYIDDVQLLGYEN